MAKDDYYVIVYRILAYLYIQLKAGAKIDESMINYDGKLAGINEKYWTYIMENLLGDEYIRGIVIQPTWDNEKEILNLENCEITPKGIDYLCNNNTLERAKRFLKDMKEITPFI